MGHRKKKINFERRNIYLYSPLRGIVGTFWHASRVLRMLVLLYVVLLAREMLGSD